MPYRAPSISQFAAFILTGAGLTGGFSTSARGAAYVSGVGISGTTVNFILNEPADLLAYSINGGPVMVLDGSTNGSKSFDLTSPTDSFQIAAVKSDTVGYTIPTGT